jgi:cell division protein FtsA
VHSPSRPNKPLTRLDVNRAIEVARLLSKKSNREIVQETVQDFIVDGQGSISNPVGMHANKLEADVYFVTGSVSNFTMTIKEAVKKAGMDVEGVIMKPIASAEAALSHLEKKLGVLLVDLGHTSTSLAAFSDGKIIGAKILAAGAEKITNEIAARFHLPAHAAEKVKRERARALADEARQNRYIHLQPDSNSEKIRIPEKALSEIAEKNLKELFDLVRQESEKFKFPRGRSESIVLTGGGALLKDIDKYVSRRFEIPVRIGRPDGKVEGWGRLLSNPSYCTARGLISRGLNDRQLSYLKEIGWQNPLLKIQTWIKEFF